MEPSQSIDIFYLSCNASMRWWASDLEKYFSPKLSTYMAKVVLHVLCLYRPVLFGIGLYLRGVRALTSLLNAKTPASDRGNIDVVFVPYLFRYLGGVVLHALVIVNVGAKIEVEDVNA